MSISLFEQLDELRDKRLLHAYRCALILGDIMLQYYNSDYPVTYSEGNFDKQSGLALHNDPGAIKLFPDKLTNDLAKLYLTSLYPDYGFLGEESFEDDCRSYGLLVGPDVDTANGAAGPSLFWCVDPICGSMGYRKKTGSFGTSIALVDKQRGPIIGVLHCPVLGYSGAASIDDEFCSIEGNFPSPRREGLNVLVSANRKSSRNFEEMLRILGPVQVDYLEGVPPKTIQVLAGAYDLYFSVDRVHGGGLTRLWDLAASSVFFRLRKMVFTDIFGEAFDLRGGRRHIFADGLIAAKDENAARLCRTAFSKLFT